MSTPPEHVVVDASVMVDLLARTRDRFSAVRVRLSRTVMHVPAHFDEEVLSALGRLYRAEVLTVGQVDSALAQLGRAPLIRHDLSPLVMGAWARREALQLTDALYVELAAVTGLLLLTTDHRLARSCPLVEAIG